MTDIKKLLDELNAFAKYGSALSVLGWDEEVNLPTKAHAYRGEVSALIGSELHQRFTDPKFYQLVCSLAKPETYKALTSDQKIIVRETLRDVELSRKLPTAYVEKMSLLSTKAFSLWVKARKEKDFKIYQAVLSEIVEMKKREADYLGYKGSPYDALLDEHETGLTTKELDKLLPPLATSIKHLVSKAPKPTQLPSTNYPISKQVKLNTKVASALGYDLDAGRIDVSPHPFTTSFHTTDVRVTTRYDENDFWVSLGSTIHEVGHALYDQGLPEKYFGTPLGEAVSYGIHESQSRSWENFVGRSPEFVSYLYPHLQELFNVKYSQEQLYNWLSRVEPHLIRVESDEVTYNLHIVIRYEIEKALMEGDIQVPDLPHIWNERIQHYLGLNVPDDALGVLQDVHWSHGSIGYFPTYTLGNLYAAQVFNSFAKAHPTYKAEFSAGNFSSYLKWLRKNIHQHGRRYQPLELIKKVTGEKLDPSYLIEHLSSKI